MIFTAQIDVSQGQLIYFCEKTKEIKFIRSNEDLFFAQEKGYLMENARKDFKKGENYTLETEENADTITAHRLQTIKRVNATIRKMGPGEEKAKAIAMRDAMARNVAERMAEKRGDKSYKTQLM